MCQFVQVTSSRTESNLGTLMEFHSPSPVGMVTDEPRLTGFQGPGWVEKHLVNPVFLNCGVTAVFAV